MQGWRSRLLSPTAERSTCPTKPTIDNQIKTLQQSRARCSHGSHQWNHRSSQLRKLYERRSHLRDETDRHIAKTIATTPNICAVGAEITNNKGLVASAAGTAEHPGTSVAAKRTLNRLLHSSRFAGVRVAIERACAKVAKLYVPVPAPGTSSMCHRCGGKGIRESQAVFRCPSCGWVGNADFNAAHNVDHRTCTHLSIDWVRKTRRPGRSSLDGRAGETRPAHPVTRPRPSPKNTNPTMGTIVYKPQYLTAGIAGNGPPCGSSFSADRYWRWPAIGLVTPGSLRAVPPTPWVATLRASPALRRWQLSALRLNGDGPARASVTLSQLPCRHG